MDHGLMNGMLIGGLVVAAVPVLLTVGVGVYALRQFRAARARERLPAPKPESAS